MREIKIGEKTFNVHYGQNALCALEDALDEGIDSIVKRYISGKVALKDFRALIWAGLLKEHRGMTLDALGELCDMAGVRFSELVPPCFEELISSYERLIPDSEGDKEADKKN